MDRFSHLAIYSAVQCLVMGKRDLWQRFNNDDNLLFREADFQRPEESELFQTLWELEDFDARTIAGHLALACRQPLAAAPWLDQIISRGRVRLLTRGEHEAVASLMAAGKALARLKVSAAAVSAGAVISGDCPDFRAATRSGGPKMGLSPLVDTEIGTAPILAELVPEAPAAAWITPAAPPLVGPPAPPAPPVVIDTRPAAAEGTVPAAPPVAAGFPTARESLWELPLAAVRAVDGLFGRLVGEENGLLRRFLWVAVPALLFMAVWLAASLPWRRPSPVAPVEVAVKREPKSLAKPIPVNHPPVRAKKEVAPPTPLRLRPIAPQTVEAGKPLSVVAAVENADVWKGKLRIHARRAGPARAEINAQTGTLTWTPGAHEAPGPRNVTVSVEAPDGRKDQTSFTVAVAKPAPPISPAPRVAAKEPKAAEKLATSVAAEPKLRLRPLPPRTVAGDERLTVGVSVENAKRWKGKLRFSLGNDAPSGSRINPRTGQFTWTPRGQAGTYTFPVSVASKDGHSDQTLLKITVQPTLPRSPGTAIGHHRFCQSFGRPDPDEHQRQRPLGSPRHARHHRAA